MIYYFNSRFLQAQVLQQLSYLRVLLFCHFLWGSEKYFLHYGSCYGCRPFVRLLGVYWCSSVWGCSMKVIIQRLTNKISSIVVDKITQLAQTVLLWYFCEFYTLLVFSFPFPPAPAWTFSLRCLSAKTTPWFHLWVLILIIKKELFINPIHLHLLSILIAYLEIS